jgi:hypothetical protein
MKKCSKCGTQNLDDANFCEKCGNKLGGFPWKIIIAGAAVVSAGVAVMLYLNIFGGGTGSGDADCDSYRSIPRISGETKKAAIAILETNGHGGVQTYVIQRDANKNWKLHINGNNYRSYKSMDNVTPVETFINETALNNNPDRMLYAYKNSDKEFIRDKLRVSQYEAAMKWRPDDEIYYLIFSAVPSSILDSSCLVVVDKNQIILSYMEDGALKRQPVLNAGYQTDAELNSTMFENAVRLIPQKRRFYLFTSGYRLTGINLDRYADDDFVPTVRFIQKQISNGDKNINRIMDIYKIIQTVTGQCLIYRKDACPEIGYLLYKINS